MKTEPRDIIEHILQTYSHNKFMRNSTHIFIFILSNAHSLYFEVQVKKNIYNCHMKKTCNQSCVAFF
jgi:hypothetical protein